MSLTRRFFLVSSSAAAALALYGDRRLLAQAAQPAAAPPAGFSDVRGSVRLFAGRGGTIGVRASEGALVVVDSQFPDTAKTCLDGVMKDRGTRRLVLFNTHHHGDHTGGNAVFKEAGFEIRAHANVPGLQKKAAGEGGTAVPQAYAEQTFTDSTTFGDGPEQIVLKHYGPAHTGGDAVVHFVRENVVHMGDLVFNRRHPFIDRPAGASIRNWIVTLETVAREHDADARYIFGHAGDEHPVVGERADLMVMRDYLTALIEAATRAVKDGTPREAFTASKLPPAFAIYDPKTPQAQPNPRFGLAANLGIAYDEVSGGK